MSFKPRTVFPDYRIPLSTFKGHHQKALTRFGHLAPQVDVVLEVRDSRAPISTTNMLFDKVLARKQKIIVYSKNDLSVVKSALLKKWHGDEKFICVNGKNKLDADKVLKALEDFHKSLVPPPPLGLRAMIVGMPNVGKSTLVNTLRSVGLIDRLDSPVSTKVRKACRTGSQPGVTRNTSEIIRLRRDPDILLYDTPGICLPTVKDSYTMLTLGLVGCVDYSHIDPVVLADYLLFLLNLQDPTGSSYANVYKHPTNSIDELLDGMATTQKKKDKHGNFDENKLAQTFVSNWREGRGKKYRVLFDQEAISQTTSEDVHEVLKAEKERLQLTSVYMRIENSLGIDGTAQSKNRKRTAKDREYDLRNQLFKL